MMATGAGMVGLAQDTCPGSVGALCIPCPTPASARDSAARSALSALGSVGIADVPMLDTHMGRVVAGPQCAAWTSHCGRLDAACAASNVAADTGPGCEAPRLEGRTQPLTVVAAVSVASDGADFFQSSVVTGPLSPGQRLLPAAEAAGSVRVFNASVLNSAARGFSTAISAGRWIFYIPGCYSDHTTVAVLINEDLSVLHLCTTLVRYDKLCGSGNWENSSCFESVDLRSMQRFFSLRNKINFGSAVYDGVRHLYLISGTGDENRAPIAVVARLDIHCVRE
jgi:hypothetical protein